MTILNTVKLLYEFKLDYDLISNSSISLIHLTRYCLRK